MQTSVGQALSLGALLERDDAMATLATALRDAHLGRGRVLLVTGEAGIGKTALVRAFCRDLDDETRVLTGSCDALATPRPLGPFCDIASSAGGAFSDLVQLGAPPTDVFAALRDELGGPATVLVLEDLHWADEATLDVVRLLARRIETLPALVLGTYRDDGLGGGHPMRALSGELATVATVGRLALSPLSTEAVAELAWGHDIDPGELHKRTGGNPFFVTQVLEAGGTVVPTTVRDAILGRTARLSPGASALLEVVAIAPPRVEAWLLEKIAEDPVDHLSECMAAGMLTADTSGVAFRHELTRLAIEESLTPTRRVMLHRRVLAALGTPPSGARDLARLAHHAEAANDVPAILEYGPAAAARAASLGAYREAAAQYARALRFSVDAPAGERATLLEGRSRACYLADDQVEAIAVIREAIACRREQNAPAHEARALCELSDYLYCRGLLPEADAAVVEATQLIEGQPESHEVAFVRAATAYKASVNGDLDGCAALAQAAIDIAERCDDGEIAGQALVTLGTAQIFGDVATGRETLERAVKDGLEHRRPQQVARALNNLGALDRENADVHLPRALEYCIEQNVDLWRINVLAVSARASLDRGRWDEAAEFAARLLQDPRDSPWPHLEAFLVLALVRARRGDPEARAALEGAYAVGISPEKYRAVADLAAAHAEIAWLERRPDEIDAATTVALATATRYSDVEATSRLLHWRRLAGLEVKAPHTATGPYALALADRWEEAAAAWARSCSPYEEALALAETGEEAALRRAHDLATQLGAHPLAQLVVRRLREAGARDIPRGPRPATRKNPAGLTSRESEVLALLAEGLRNSKIANRLVVSRRTVDHHVSAVLRKLGVSTRGEAVVAATRLGMLEDR